jgi:dolichol-phosphate mannosyltransferase
MHFSLIPSSKTVRFRPNTCKIRRIMSVYVVLPVVDEAENVEKLVQEFSYLKLDQELVICYIDDSDNNLTVEAIKKAQAANPSLNINVYHRTGDDCKNGLAGAVTAGMQLAIQANANNVVVMDGDGQHPPSVIPAMLREIDSGNDLVVASRYAPGGSHEGLDGTYRQFVSMAAIQVAKLLFPTQLRKVTDPMTGLFTIRVSRIDIRGIETNGFKILLEILLKTPGIQIAEVPVIFRNRLHGDSKASVARGIEYLLQLGRLRRTINTQFKQKEVVGYEM